MIDLNISNTYSGKYRWDEARERIPNDYKDKDWRPTEYPNATGKEVWEDDDFLADMELDSLIF